MNCRSANERGIDMIRYNINGFYGEYGYITKNDDGSSTLEIVFNGYLPAELFHKDYTSFKGAKIALGKMLDSYRLAEVKGV